MIAIDKSKAEAQLFEIKPIRLGEASYHSAPETMTSEHLQLDGEPYIRIRNVDSLQPFLITVVSNGDPWLFVGSNSPFTAGRVDSDHALFPYQTADKILRHADSSGALTIFLVEKNDEWVVWEPWKPSVNQYKVERNLYKHAYGTAVIFEEINFDLGLRFTWRLTTSEAYGIVRSCTLENVGIKAASVRYLDGWHQLMPPGVYHETFMRYSYLAAAYMRHEYDQGLGIFTLNSGITDRAEPSESLRATCAWSLGHKNPSVLLSDRQVYDFRRGKTVTPEYEVRGEVGAYLVSDSADVKAQGSHSWITAADIGVDHTALMSLRGKMKSPCQLNLELNTDLRETSNGLVKRIAAADGLQETADQTVSVHHFANVLFNCMRGGTLNDSYKFPSGDFVAFLRSRNSDIDKRHTAWLQTLPQSLDLTKICQLASERNDPHLDRLTREYLPLSFSRRHGDPSRPWNRFAIHIKDEDGNLNYGYQGNWRDIFQNWESLGQSYPVCLASMIAVFLNASTADGYNPYRITREGIDWEVLDAQDPWSNIGYWGDHQIIYLLRLLEAYQRFQPGTLTASLGERLYAYASVPYEIKSFEEVARDPHQSITFNHELHQRLLARAAQIGNDGKLYSAPNGEVLLVSLAEKLLAPLLAKLSNFVPEGGIWLNTQRPEWNDANNALAGWGLSMVTVYHLRRYLTFIDGLFQNCQETILISASVVAFLEQIKTILLRVQSRSNDVTRFEIVSALGEAGQNYRQAVYSGQLGQPTEIPIGSVRELLSVASMAMDETIQANRRQDGMVHSYNLLSISDRQASVSHLQLMLEGQVAVLGSGALQPESALALLKALRGSALYREDQNSYLLYPDRGITPFLSRNILPKDSSTKAPLLAGLIASGDRSLVITDQTGAAHFHADLTNSADLRARLDQLAKNSRWSEAVQRDRTAILELWETVFHHNAFTGRSGSMFAFEGLGSIYWHMIAKLLLAVQECRSQAIESGADAAIIEELSTAYYDIQHGLGFTKTPETYGAFPTDPYSHSPRHRGAQQPGMTGQVKEEILTRLGELGVTVKKGCLQFAPTLLRHSEFFPEAHSFSFIDINGQATAWKMLSLSLGFSYCQVPVCYQLGVDAAITIYHSDASSTTVPGNTLSQIDSVKIFNRSGEVTKLLVTVPLETLRA